MERLVLVSYIGTTYLNFDNKLNNNLRLTSSMKIKDGYIMCLTLLVGVRAAKQQLIKKYFGSLLIIYNSNLLCVFKLKLYK